MTSKIKKELNPKIERAIKNYWKENYEVNLSDEKMEKLSLFELLDAFLSWEGILGYTHYIMDIIDYKG